ncbi:MAG: ribonuclease PH [Thermoanaerobaculia bacterium]|nr:ribonuclease PH [Thermoanaerobaculia bacterium]
MPARAHGRAADAMRAVRLETGVQKFAEGSALIEVGDTRVLASATVEKRVPPWLIDSGRGWATAEYAMLPSATPRRNQREVTRGRPSGRSTEIQRLIGRSLRAVLDLTALRDHTLILDCDVLQADGGTRTASITAAWVAAVEACAARLLTGDLERWPFGAQVAAISAGIVDGEALLDLDAAEDQSAEADFNFVATSDGLLVEVQGTGEKRGYRRAELDRLLDLGLAGIDELMERQRRTVAATLAEVEAVTGKPDRRPAPAKDEKDLWGEP